MPNTLDIKELNGLTEEERAYALKILEDLSKGDQTSYEDLIYSDYKEIPVDIETFLHDMKYLGKGLTDDEGRFTVFPYWEDMLKKLFPNNIDTTYNTLVLSGAIGLGKSFIAVVALLYMLYRMLCLKDPYKHYGLQPIDLITFSFMNITKDAAQGVAWNKCQQLVQMSPWFMAHGTVNKADIPEWSPNGGIELIYGSQPRHIIGRAVFCLDGETIIKTTDGDKKIKDLVEKEIRVYSINNGNVEISNTCKVIPTIESEEECWVELNGGFIIKCTPNHRFMLKDGTYREAQYLSKNDELLNIQFQNNSCNNATVEIKSVRTIRLDYKKQFYDVIEATPYHNFLIKTNNQYIVSHNCSFEDEISFQINQDVEKQKVKAKALISSVDARMQSRFMKGEKMPTLHILASSKRTDQSFLETYIDMKKKNGSTTTLIIDEPQWVIRTDKDSPRKFAVAVGNKFLDSEVLPLSTTEDELQLYRDKGFSILMVPMGYYENFLDDLDIALTDIAGISTSNNMCFISGVRWAKCRKEWVENPFTKEVITVGNGLDDKAQYYDFFDLSKVPSELKSRPLYIHLDMSLSGDKTGIAGVWILGKTPHKDGVPDSKELYYRLAFSISVKAPKGHQVSFEKNRQFIYWLKENGFHIKGVSYDTYQSADLGQTLLAHGYNCGIISVDRLNDGVCLPYQTLKSAINEERIETYFNKQLQEEIVGLVRDGNGKIDHSPSGINSKDQADALCLHPDTEVFLLSGKHKTIKQLFDNHKNEWVLSYNTETNEIEPVEIKEVVNNGYKESLVKLTLDNGDYLICTDNHKILCQDGKYRDAKDCLELNLMPLAVKNKRVIKIESVAGSEVYDIKLDKIHNFALTNGIFVHNCGALYNASLHAEEYAYDYGEDLDVITEVSSQSNTNDRKQVSIAFEEELKRIYNPMQRQPQAEKQPNKAQNGKPHTSSDSMFKDFGMGKAKPLASSAYYLSQGIIDW